MVSEDVSLQVDVSGVWVKLRDASEVALNAAQVSPAHLYLVIT